MKVALVFDNQVRPETTGYYCRRALARLTDVEHVLPHELPSIDASIFDLFLFVDDGLDYEIPKHCRPRAAWAIDTHVDRDRCLRRFGDADDLFAAQKNGAAALQQQLGRTVHWLPLACDPDIHRPLIGEEKCHDVAFVGHFVGFERPRLLEQLMGRYPTSWFGQALFDDMARMYSRARVGFNCSLADDLNMRLFEIPACGLPLVTNAIDGNGLDELFETGRHLLTYRTPAELFEQVDRLLSDRRLAERIAREGLSEVRLRHTYDLRMRQVLQTVSRQPVAVSLLSKSQDYFEFDRPDVRSLIPEACQRILDLGCGGGRMGEALKAERRCSVVGIESRAEAADRAGRRLDRVLCESLETISDSLFPEAAFDCIVLADVLEHLRQPLRVLRICRHWLTDTGALVISIPNSRHHSIVSGLMDGNWTYERAGLLDDDHVRCFTRRELDKLLYRAGFESTQWSLIPGSGYAEWDRSGRPGTVRAGNLQIEGLSAQDAEEFFIYQHLVRARRRPLPDYGVTSVIIVTYNQLEFTRQCVDSILLRTDAPTELIFVDNGSTDGTPDYLQSIPGARIILNSRNLGFAPAVNQGIRIASGRQILLLNNDCIVTTGWLDRLLEVLYDDPRNGLVGPVSNQVSGAQQIPVAYPDLASLDGFAWDQRLHRQLIETDRLVGFCLLFRREVPERIGGLDEQFEIGCFEDDDFCRRAIAAGFRALIAPQAFVHHFGSATFRASGFDLGEILQKNGLRYENKWAVRPDNGSPQNRLDTAKTDGGTALAEAAHAEAALAEAAHAYVSTDLPSGEPLLQRREVRLSLCMIVRDNEDTIEACLDSIYPWVDEIIIVDTGSKDRTMDICRRFGARMFEFPWCDDFSAARNKSIEPARGEWIFWMDSDDVIDPEQGRLLRALVYGSHAEDCFGYVMQVHCPSDAPGQMTIVDHLKIFRNRPDLRFEHRIHEQILPAIRRAGGQVAFTDLHVVHSGSRQTPETRQRKLERDFRILQQDLECCPDHPFVLFNLGMTHEDCGNYAEAETFLTRSIQRASEGESHLPKAWALLVNCQRQSGRRAEAIRTADEALKQFPEDRELLFRRATLLHEDGRLPEAAAAYESVTMPPGPVTFRSLDVGICGYKAFYNLGLVHREMGNDSAAVLAWEKAVTDCPSFDAAWIGLAQALARLHRLEELEQLRIRVPDTDDLRSCRALVIALGHESQGDLANARQVLERECQHAPFDVCLDELARILFRMGAFADSRPVLQSLNKLRPGDASVLHNLGISCSAAGNAIEAASCLKHSLQLRPDSESTRQLLAEVERAVAAAGPATNSQPSRNSES